MLFFAYIYDLKRIDAFFVIPRPYDFLKWQFIRCLIFADNKGKDGPVKQYLKEAKRAYEDYTNLNYVEENTRKDLLEKAEVVAKQFLEKRKRIRDENWEDTVEGAVPWAAINALRGRFRKRYGAFIVVVSVLLICPGCPCVFSNFQSLGLPISGLVLLEIAAIIAFSLYLVREGKNPSFLKNLHECWDVIIRIEQNYEMKKNQQEKDIQKKKEMYKKIKKEVKEGIRGSMKKIHRGDIRMKACISTFL